MKEVKLVYDESIAEEYRREQEQKKANERARDEVMRIAEEGLPPKKNERDLWQTAAVRNKKMGTFYYDERFRTIDWRHPAGEEISLPPADWNLLANALPEIMRTLGVDQQEIEKEV